MKKIALLILTLTLLISCKSDDNDQTEPQSGGLVFDFVANFDSETVESGDFGDIKFTNAFGTEISVERLRYLISDIKLTNTSGDEFLLKDYQFVDIGNGNNIFSVFPQDMPPIDNYTLTATFGFNNDDNIDGAYPDLNIANWNVPEMLGGGYHYMQLEGKFVDENQDQTAFQYHTIRAVDITGPAPVFEDTFIELNLGQLTITEDDRAVRFEMNVSEWFKNPITWNLNELNSVLMPNFEAQKMMFENGQSAFSITQGTTLQE